MRFKNLGLAVAGKSVSVCPVEWKFAADEEPGTVVGYGAVFNNVDGGGDLILPGAFKKTLADRKRRKGSFPIYIQHGMAEGLDPVGRWVEVEEDDKGLKVKGRLSGMDTDRGKFNYARLRDGTFGGLSIGYAAWPEHVKYGKLPGEPVRTLKQVELYEVSLVDEPMNALARIQAVKGERLRKQLGVDGEELMLSIPIPDGMSLTDALAYAIEAAGLSDLDPDGPAAAAKALLGRKGLNPPTTGGDSAAAFWAAMNAGLPR